MIVQKKKIYPDVADYFKELSFYNTYIEKQQIKLLKNIDLLFELLFYEWLNVIKSDHAFKGSAMSYKVELVEKNPLIS